MKRLIRTILASLALAIASVGLVAPAQAGDPQIETAKQQGVVGETISGFLGIVDGGADPALVRAVQDINNKRRAAYDKLAQQTGTTMEQVARVTGEKLIAAAAPGEYIMNDSGSWTRK